MILLYLRPPNLLTATPHSRRRKALQIRAGLLFGLMLGGACGAQELNSERIERLFGNYHIDALEQSSQLRIANLYSIKDELAISRTLAIVRYKLPVAKPLRGAHQEIVSGASIGAILQGNGWKIRKINLHMGEFNATAKARRVASLMRITLPTALAFHVYQLHAVGQAGEFEYATIIELHHPDYLTAAALRTIYDALPAKMLTADEFKEIKDVTQRSISD